jgi:hypothetical protein
MEIWSYIKDLLDQNLSNFINGLPGVLQLPEYGNLIAQFSTRKWFMTSKGKMMLESKKDMKKRGLNSPDRADAFVLTFGEYLVEPDEHIMSPMIDSVTIKEISLNRGGIINRLR